jgi:hypothetical protein
LHQNGSGAVGKCPDEAGINAHGVVLGGIALRFFKPPSEMGAIIFL